jgi:hypothetical protein
LHSTRRDSVISGYDSDSGNSTDIGTDEDVKEVKPKFTGDCDVVPTRSDEVPVYVINSSTTNQLVYGAIEIGVKGWNSVCPAKPLLPPSHIFSTKNKKLYKMIATVTQVIPAVFFDAFLKMSGSRLRLSRLNNQIISGQEVMSFFFLNNLVIESKNTQAQLKNGMDNEDQKTFSIDTRRYDWLSYFKIYVQGVQKFILKEDTNDYSKAQKVYNRMMTVQSTLLTSVKFGMDFLLANVGVQSPMWQSNSYNFGSYHSSPHEYKCYRQIQQHMENIKMNS